MLRFANRSAWFSILLMLGCLSLVAITSPPRTLLAQVDEKGSAPAKVPVTLIGEIVTSGEYVDAAKAIEAAAKNDPAAFAAYFDMVALADKALEGVDVTEQFRKGYRQGLTNVPAEASLPGQLSAAVRNGGGYRLLRVHKQGDKHSALFRMDSGAGLNYHDLKFVKGKDDKIKVDDAFVLLTGELMSTTLRQLVLPVAARQNSKLLEKLTPEQSDYVQNFPKVLELTAAIRAKDFDKAMEVYRGLPKSLQEVKGILLNRFNIASQTQHWDETRATIADYRRLFPGDGTAELLSIDVFILEKKFDQALAAVDRIDKIIGGDPELDTLRANIRALKQQN